VQAIETERLIIRNFTTDDGSALYKMIVQYQQSPYAKYDHPWPADPEEIRGVAKWFADGDHYLAVCLKPSGVFIGFVCLNPEEHDGEPALNIGYIFDADYYRQGYATEAGRAALARAFNDLGVSRVVTGTARQNLPSVRLLARLGLKETDEGPGCYAITREEWRGAVSG
jgi:ribosomal-protein-alanine N-acetyltransferase